MDLVSGLLSGSLHKLNNIGLRKPKSKTDVNSEENSQNERTASSSRRENITKTQPDTDTFDVNKTTFYKVFEDPYYEENKSIFNFLRKKRKASIKRVQIGDPTNFRKVESAFDVRDANLSGLNKKTSVSLSAICENVSDNESGELPIVTMFPENFVNEEKIHDNNSNHEASDCSSISDHNDINFDNESNAENDRCKTNEATTKETASENSFSSEDINDVEDENDDEVNIVLRYNVNDMTVSCCDLTSLDEVVVTSNLDEFMSQSTPELLKSIHQFPSKCDKSSQIPKFPPAVDDNAVEIRRKSTARNPRCSRTLDLGKSQLISKHQDSKYFEIKGLVKFQLPDQTIITKLNQDYISYENGSFYKKGNNRLSKDLLRKNVIIKSVRYLNKNKEVELRDSLNLSYVIYFDSPKYAKQFMDNDVIQGFVEENSTNAITIKKRLLGFLGRRSTREDLEKIGIIKNEPIFGNTLRAIYQKGGAKFIYKVIELIERPENMKSLGLYRTSGNLAMIQKIRFQVDNGKLEILDQFARDPDVLTGSLKLFFRELKEPLISMEACEELISFAKKDPLKLTPQEVPKINSVLTKTLHDANRETLYVLVRHLIEVVKHKNDNKMDTYNLSVCWGPSIMFQVVTSPSAMEKCFDLVTQSQDAMRLVEFLLTFYITYPEELRVLGTSTSLNIRINDSKQQTSSKESLDSCYSQKSKSASDQSLHVDEVVKKAIDLIELNLPCEDLYTKVVSSDRANKILKKLTKKKDTDTEKTRIDPTDVGEALKKYLRDSQEWLITRDVFEKVLIASKDYHGLYLDPYTRDKVTKTIENLPKKDTFIFLMRHFAKIFDDKNLPKYKKDELYLAWTKVLNHQKRISPSDENFIKFLQVCTKVLDLNSTNNLPDLVPHAELLKDLKSEQQRIATLSKKRTQSLRVSESDRYSRYDNIDFDIGEAQILDDDDIEQKTEDTKL